MFDRGLGLYERLSREAPDGKGIAPSNLYDVDVAPLGPSIREMFAARMQANAARAVALGLGGDARRRAAAALLVRRRHRPADGHDPDATRPRCWPVNQRAFPYGGMELARLYDGDQRVVSNVGGRPWASFGVLVRDSRRKEIADLAAAQGRAARAPAARAADVARAAACGSPSPTRSAPTAGRSRPLVARGRTQVAARSPSRPRTASSRDWIETRWRIARRMRGRYTVDVLFPSWGKARASRRSCAGGRRVTLAGAGQPRRRVSLRDVAYFYLAGEDSGYVVVPIGRGRARRAHVLRPQAQSSAPRPGPTLALQLAPAPVPAARPRGADRPGASRGGSDCRAALRRARTPLRRRDQRRR